MWYELILLFLVIGAVCFGILGAMGAHWLLNSSWLGGLLVGGAVGAILGGFFGGIIVMKGD